MVSDPVADFIIRIKNGSRVRKASVVIPYSKLKHAIADVLSATGFVGEVEKEGKGVRKSLIVKLNYKEDGTPRIQDVQRISKPGRRMYASVKEIFPVRYGKGALILSTPKGILTDQQARKERVGGEQLFKIW